jgi:hypothetical protein
MLDQDSFFWLQNKEGLTLVGVFMEGTTLTCLEGHFDTKQRTLMLERFIPRREALVHSIPISEVKDMKSDVLRALKAFLSRK